MTEKRIANAAPPDLEQHPIGAAAPAPGAPGDEHSITSSWDPTKPVVTVVCMTYQHAPYIEEALWGFLNQRSTYPFEILVRDDASTDGTQEIIQEYAARYPNVIKPILEPRNVGRSDMNAVYEHIHEAGRGRYFATCEGDDYWIDPEKIETQARFLDEHLAYNAVAGWAVPAEGGVIIGPPRGGHSVRTVMYRRGTRFRWPPRAEVYFGDTYQAKLFEYASTLFTLPRLMAVWRKHASGVFGQYVGTDDRYLHYQRAKTRYWVAVHLESQGEKALARSEFLISLSFMARASGMSWGGLVANLLLKPVRSRVERAARRIMRRARRRT